MANEIQYRNHTAYNNGTSAENNIKLLDITPFQHEDLSSGVNKLGKMLVAQSFCEPVAVCNSNNPQNGAYVATCLNYPDFALSYQDAQQNTKYLIGLKIRVIFTYGITYGSVSGGTYPTLNINGSGAIPMLAQGKTMATGSASAGQTLEFTVIPYGNGIAFDADSNVRESTSDYTIYTDGKTVQHLDIFNHVHFTVPEQAETFYYQINTNCLNYEIELVAFNGFCRARGIHEANKGTYVSPPTTAGYALSNLSIFLTNWLMTFQSDRGSSFDVDLYFRQIKIID